MIVPNKRPLSSVLVPKSEVTREEGWGEVNKLLHAFLFTAFFLLTAHLQAQTVYITKTGARYHKESCRYAKPGWASELAAVKKKGLTSCLVCKPSNTETNEAKPIPLSSVTSNVDPVKETKPAQTTSSQFKATTKAGYRCSRKSAV